MPCQVKHLTAMLFRKGVSKSDASALRYALHVLENSVYRPKAIAHKDFPYWRMVRYTDDGCSEYQCLNCKGTWEGRGAPGWVDIYEEVDEKDGTWLFTEDGEKKFFRIRERPRYKADWKYCPHCNIEWHGQQET